MRATLNISKIWKYGFIIIAISTFCRISVYGQELSDTNLFKTLFIPEVVTKEYSTYLRNSESEIKVVFAFYFFCYKEFISSQDVDACVFYPSCSNYTIEAIENRGLVVGLLSGFDRLLRCHPNVNKGDYPYNIATMKYYDPY
jgi:uncharacterized protein